MPHKSVRTTALSIFLVSLFVSGCERVDPNAAIARAEQAIGARDYRTAVIELKSLLKDDVANARARWLLSEVYLAVEDGASAEKELERARSLGVGEEAILPALAQAFWLQEESDRILALPLAVGLSEYARDQMRAYRALAQLSNQRLDAAIEELEQITRDGQTLPSARLARVRLMLAQEGLDVALPAVEALTSDNPDFATAWSELGDIYGKKRQFSDAESAYSRAVELRLNPLTDRLKRGFARVEQEQWEGALADAEFVAEAAPDLALGHYLAGLVKFRQQKLTQAQDSLERALDLDPRHFETVFLLATVDARLGNTNRSKQLAEQAVALRPSSVRARKLATIWYLRDDKGGDAEAMIRPLVRAQPDDLEAKEYLAASLMRQGKSDEAVVLLQQIAERDPSSSSAKLKVGLGLLSAGNADAGIAVLNDARAVAPEDPLINASLVGGYLRQKNVPAAMQAARDFHEARPNDPLAHNLLAASHLAMGQKAQAVTNYERALELDPANLKARQMLTSIALADRNFDRALASAKTGLAEHADDLQLLLLQAEVGRLVKDEELNRRSLQRAIDAHPEESVPRGLMARQLLDANEPEKALAVVSRLSNTKDFGVLLARAEANHRLNRLNDSKRDLETLVRLRPESLEFQSQLARTYEALEDWANLERTLNRILVLAPDEEWAALARAQLEILSGNPAKARTLLVSKGLQPENNVARLTIWTALARSEKSYDDEAHYAKQLLEIQPTTRHAILLTNAHQRSGTLQDAERVLVGWLAKHPKDLTAHVELANLYKRMGATDESVEQLRRIESLDEENLFALNNLAWDLREKSPVEAMSFAERALKVAPDEPAVVDTFAAVATENQDYPTALRAIDRAIDRGLQTGGLRLRRAEILYAMGDKEGAIEELEALVASAPRPSVQERAKKKLAKLSRSQL